MNPIVIAVMNALSKVMNDVYSQAKQIFVNKLIYSTDITDICRMIDYKYITKYFKNIPIKVSNYNIPNSFLSAAVSIGTVYDFIKYKNTYIILSVSNKDHSKIVTLTTINNLNNIKELNRFIKYMCNESKSCSIKTEKDYYAVIECGDYDRFYPNKSKRTFKDVFIPNEIKTEIITNIEKFLNNKQFYNQHNIGYHFGILLYGPPGTGKSSIIASIINEFNLTPYFVDVKDINYLINNKQRIRFDFCRTDDVKIIVIEDVDSCDYLLSNKYKIRRYDCEFERKDNSIDNSDIEISDPNLSEFLNIIDGFDNLENVMWILTTNHIEKLNNALLRDGRMDKKILIDYVTNETFINYIKYHYNVDISDRNINVKENVSFATIQLDIMTGKSVEYIIDNYCK